MRFPAYSLLLCIVLSCKPANKVKSSLKLDAVSILTGCPEDGDCEVELIRDKKIEYKYEKETELFYPEYKIDSTTNLIQVKFDKHQDAVDAQYREEIVFEWPKTEHQLNLENKALKDVHFTFSRFCFCEPKTVGYFIVEKGYVVIGEHKIKFKLNNSYKSPQVIDSIEIEYSLK